MARAIGGWLSGPPIPAGSPPGVRLGFPAEGPGSVASIGSRIGAFIVDAIVANLVAGLPYLFGVRYTLDTRNIAVLGAFLLIEFIFDGVYGQTVGKRMFNIRVIRVDGDGLASLPWLLLRTVLLGALIPAVVWDRDRRGLHDKASGTIVVVDPDKARRTPSAKRPTAVNTAAKPAVKAGGPARTPKRAPANAGRQKAGKKRR